MIYRSLAFGVTFLLCAAGSSFAQPAPLWSDLPALSQRTAELAMPTAYRTLRLDRAGMKALLASAPAEGDGGGVVVPLPMPDGTLAEFAVVEAPVMAPGLQARYPQLRAYVGQGITDPAAAVRISHTPSGFRAQVLAPGGTVYIDPHAADEYVAYRKSDAPAAPERAAEAFANERIEAGPPDGSAPERRAEAVRAEAGAVVRRTYRLALAATGEYTRYHSKDKDNPTVAEGLEALVVALARVNGLYERDLAVRFELVADNDAVVYTDPDTDPYTNNDGSTMLSENQSNLDETIGAANYDVGHVFSTGGGGIAGLGVVCTSSKARGVTGLSNPTGDPFYVDYVAHEIGHQLRASHTFNASNSYCVDERNGATAYEPGSGSTIMAYAGICGTDNLQEADGSTQWNSDDYFHAGSLMEMRAFITTGSGSTCGTTTTTNTAPEVAAESGFTIPVGTPFTLTGSATDAETPAALTFTWEEVDADRDNIPEASAPPGRDDWNEQAPFFRSFPPSPDPTRTFPQLSRLLAGQDPIVGEGLPLDGRTLRFLLTARDNAAGAGGVASAEVSVTTDASAGPFVVTYPDADATTFTAGGPLEVRWDVAGTDGGAVDAASVDVLYSADGGETFTALLEDTPNDGAATVALPTTPTDDARIMVRAVGNVFFAVNPAPFHVEEGVVASEGRPEASGFALGAVFPNPVGAGRATVTVRTDRAQHVRLAVYDALGREVAVVHDGLVGEGRAFALDAGRLSAGVYFVRAIGETFAEVRPFSVAR